MTEGSKPVEERLPKCPKCGSVDLKFEHRVVVDTDAKKTKQFVLVKCPGPHSYFLCESVTDFAQFFPALSQLTAILEENQRLGKQLGIMDGALAISARLAAGIGPLIPARDGLEGGQLEKWQKVVDAVFEAAEYAEKHPLAQWCGKIGPQSVK